MTKRLCREEEKLIKDIRNFFRLKKELNYTAIKYIRNIFIQKKKKLKQLKIKYSQTIRIS